MNRLFKGLAAAAVIALVSVFSVSAIELSAQQAVQLALENNLSLKSSYVDVSMADRQASNSWNNLFPEIGTGAGLETTNISDYFKRMQFNGQIYGSFSFNPSMITEITAAKQNYQNGLLSYSDAVAKITVNVRKLYYSIVLQDESISIRESILSSQYDRMVRAERNAANGVESQLEALQTRVTYENNKPVVQEAKVAVKASRRALAILLGIDTEQEIKLTDTIDINEYAVSLEEALSGIEKRFDIRKIEGQMKYNTLKAKAMKLSLYVPQIGVYQSWNPYINDIKSPWNGTWAGGYSKYGFSDRNYLDFGGFRVGLTWNISDMLPWSKKQQAVRDMEDMNAKFAINKQLLQETAQSEIRNLVAKIEQNLETIKASGTTVDLAQRSYEMVLKQYQMGLKDELEMRDSENQFRTAKLNRLNSQYNYISAIIDLEYASQSTIIK